MSRRRLAAVPDRPQRVVLYVRVSAVMGRGGDDFHSPEVQIGAMRRVTAGMQEVDLIDDDIDQTGRTFSRAGIEKIRKLAEAHAIDAVAVYNVSRFGRNVLESLQFLNWLAERGVTIISASEHIDTSTPSGRWMLTNMLAIAEMRSDEIGLEWGQTIHLRAKAGKHHGRPPAGYQRRADGILEPHPVDGPAVMRIFAAYAAEVQVRKIRRDYLAATGHVIATVTLKRMLRNRTYLGSVLLRGGGPAGAIEVPEAHQPLVDERTWDVVQARLARDTQTPPKLVEPQYPLSGIGRCGSCGGPTNHRPDSRKNTKSVRIFCGRQWSMVNACSGCGSSNVANVEKAVLDRIQEYIAELRYNVGARTAQIARSERAGVDVKVVQRELLATQAAKTKAAQGWSLNQMDDRTYRETMAMLDAAEERLTATLRQLKEVADLPDPGRLVALAEKLLEMWPRMNGTQRNRALRGLIKTVTIRPSSRYREPMHLRIDVEWI